MSGINKCRRCGKEVGIITWGIYRKVLVDMEVCMVVPDADGEIFVRIDGSKMRGKIAPMDLEHAKEPAEGVFRIHRCGADDDEV